MELLFNIVLVIFFAYAYYYIGVSVPKSPATELGAEQWPQLIITGLIILLLLNMYNVYKNAPAESRHFKSITGLNFPAMLKSKLFAGIVIIFAYSFALEPFGFLLSTLIMFATYARLNGQKSVKVIALTTILITFGVYFVFSKGLGIMLPRGMGFLRDIALFFESI
jgi:hypothetical protein